MSSWQCTGCRTVYPPGVPACPPCEAKKEPAMAKANAATGSSQYVAEGDPLPGDLPSSVRLVGPGVPSPELAQEIGEALAAVDRGETEDLGDLLDDEETPGPSPDSTLPASSPESSDPDDDDDYDAYPIRALRELCRARGLRITGSKAELVARLEEDDA